MLSLSRRIAIFHQDSRVRSAVLLACASLAMFVAPLYAAAPVPKNLGNGLDKILASNVAVAGLQGATRVAAAPYSGFTSAAAQGMDALAIKDSQGRYLVRINPDGAKPLKSLTSALPSQIASLEVTAVDERYRGVGVFNAWVAPQDVAALATSAGVRSVILELTPRHAHSAMPISERVADESLPAAVNGDVFNKLGTTFDQGVFQHGVDKINKFYNPAAPVDYQGQGMSIGFISNSYNDHTANPASIDVTNFDLPGAAGNPVNTQPVVVLQDFLSSDGSGDDEGRGMIQIGYKMAPKAQLAFATANLGEVGFANNIRALAGLPGFTFPGQTFAADTICDDVGYFDEPFFQDGIIGAGVNDAVAAGVSYFSSAANDIGVNGYESEIRLVPNGTGLTAAAGNTALAGTNINLSTVPAGLYAGGFHNFNPMPGQLDVAQTVNVAASNTVTTTLEWNDPYDQSGGVTLGPQIYANSGNFVSTPVVFDASSTPPLPQFVAGHAYRVIEHATGGSNYDAIVTILNPNGSTLLMQDTGVDETVTFTAPTSGQYKISFGHYYTTTGTFSFTVNSVTITQLVISDWNLLAFRTDTGSYVASSSLTTDNIATNTPVEVGYVNSPSGTTVQYVLARSNSPPAGARIANRIRYLIPGNGRAGYGPAEYFTYNTVTTSGHAMAAGTNGMAAYSVFRPTLPETFSSPGPVRIYFDASGNALQLPEIRREPRLAAVDGANVSSNMNGYFAGDTSADADTDGNFYGTSAAGPHAAAIAALVLQAHGGRHSMTPAQMTTLLQNNTFSHDLDPSFASGFATTNTGETIRITIGSDGSANTGTGGNDNNAMAVAYTGSGNLTSLSFNPQGTAATGGNVSGGNNGYLDVTATPVTQVTYFENKYPGMVFAPASNAFTVGSGSSVASGSVTATFANVAPAPSTTESWTLNLAFDSSFTSGKVLRYSVGRAEQHSASLTNGRGSTGGTTSPSYLGDLFGGGVSLPSGAINLNGMTFSGTTTGGGTFTGVMRNRVGRGYSPVDGYGMIDAQKSAGAIVQ
jgi:hypothetical protein